MSDDTSKTRSENDQLRGKPEPVGAEFLPPQGKPAANEQIADFWIARGEWKGQEKATFLQEQADRDPNESLKQRVAQTERMRAEIHADIAKEMTSAEIIERYEAMGLTARAEEFQSTYLRVEASGKKEDVERFLVKSGSDLLDAEERNERRYDAAREEPAPRTLKEMMAEAEKQVETEQRSRELGADSFKPVGHEITGRG